MGEWSDYFEDFPEENPANYVGERFDPIGAKTIREREAQMKSQVAQSQAKLNAEISAIIAKHKKPSEPTA
ncbi:hypothetical protein [Comamonas resistens]|uniref:hypothetical protein n=1 Tax=Comamonas resistens TaxID=3046670 RepID=UPI0039BCCDC0